MGVTSKARNMDDKLLKIESHLYQKNAKTYEELLNYPTRLNARLSYLKNEIGLSDTLPTKQFYDEYNVYRNRLGNLVEEWKSIYSLQIPILNKRLNAIGLKSLRINNSQKEHIPMWLIPFKN